MPEDQLSKNDLYILMESYKNNIQLNTTLLEQQKQLMVMNNEAIEKQKELCDTLDKFIGHLTTCSQRLEDNHNKVVTLIESKSAFLDAKVGSVSTQLTNMCSTNSVEHAKLTNRVYVGWAGMATIILAVLSLAITYADKFNYILKLIGKG